MIENAINCKVMQNSQHLRLKLLILIFLIKIQLSKIYAKGKYKLKMIIMKAFLVLWINQKCKKVLMMKKNETT